ncbi:enolase C-terminal domain-like protein [Caldimonas tepidiphila]|uniref:enolase C-terminal domain-like protein n=1 Tax=Caldimonas tepidiphila TaxID=2315841 RepID=UPI000E5BF5AD|nr:enolase C-terminal domain-like protein [Caldimonas tepidiphila]
MALQDSRALIGRCEVGAWTVPTDAPESDGTLAWDSTTLVLARLEAGGQTGLGYGYADTATALLARDRLAPLLAGLDALDTRRCWRAMVDAIRNLGRPGIASMAISVLDAAVWDLKARLLGLPLARLLGMARDAVPVYGSGGFTSYDDAQLGAQLGGWAAQGIRRVKMKVGRDAADDPRRVALARRTIGPDVELFVDANGAWSAGEALRMARHFAEQDVRWFEEPVSSDDLDGLRLVRERAPPGIEVTAGEYGYDAPYFRRMLAAGAVDVIQPDATRCAGVTGFLDAAALAWSFGVPLSSHCAPALHLPLCCAAPGVRHLEWFHDHARIEAVLFDGAVQPQAGLLRPDLSRPGLGLELKEEDARCFRVS